MPKTTPATTLAELTDRAAISDVVTAYATTMDRGEWELYRSIFISEPYIHFPDWTIGPQTHVKAEDWVNMVRICFRGMVATQHVITNLIIRINDDHASVDANMTARHVYAPNDVECLGGYYVYGLVRESREWKLSSVQLNATWDEGPRDIFRRGYERGQARIAQSS